MSKQGPTNEELREMAKSAQENWQFDDDTDPDGDIKRGLEFLATEGNWDQDVIDARFDNPGRGRDKWDCLEEWASFLGQVN